MGGPHWFAHVDAQTAGGYELREKP